MEFQVDFCRHRGSLHASDPSHPDVYHCNERIACTLAQSDLRLQSGHSMPACETCEIRNVVVIREPVGSALAEIIAECGVTEPQGCSCKAWQHKMDIWGINGCVEHESEIVAHLNEAAVESGWFDWVKIAARGYASSKSLLFEAIVRVRAKITSRRFDQSQQT